MRITGEKMSIPELRQEYHSRIASEIIRIDRDNATEYPNFADCSNNSSVQFAWGIVDRIRCRRDYITLNRETIGDRFEMATRDFIAKSFDLLHHIRPGDWHYSTKTPISGYDQFQHLAHMERAVPDDKFLATTVGWESIISSDIVIGRLPVSDEKINRFADVIDTTQAQLTRLRHANHEVPHPILHASISCKWTIRSDRSQNTRTEALNLIRNRKGPLPHIVAVTAEPLPTRIAALALGTGDMDCVYHFALDELRETIEAHRNHDQLDMLLMLIEGRRLRDISDLPFDLAS